MPEAVAAAARLAHRFGDGRLRIEHADGTRFDYGGAQLIYVASMVSPKRA